MTTAHSVLETSRHLGLAWRHLSFAEYFAGFQLLYLPPSERREVVRRFAVHPQWRWVFRFALSAAWRVSRTGERAPEALLECGGYAGARDQLARDLIGFGNPFLVYDAIDRDKIELPEWLERLCRWLVHRDWEPDRNFTEAWNDAWKRPVADERTLDVLETLFHRNHRNSRCLDAAWELVISSDDARAVQLRNRFLAEFATILENGGDEERALAESLVAEENFARCPNDSDEDGQPFWIGSPDGIGFQRERPRHSVTVTPFRMLRAPVTNRQFELFDPTHRWLRDDVSPDDDCPVVWVNWYMARMFCVWLSGGEEVGYRLPTEAEWEYACRAGKDGETDLFHYGDSLTSHEANFDGRFPYPNDAEQGPYRGRTTPAGTFEANAWGLYDLHGNVLEWCGDWFQEDYYQELQQQSQESGKPPSDPPGPAAGVSRVLRGGAWGGFADRCRSAGRDHNPPDVRDDFSGFRLVCCR